jgi:hypothetical protein
MDPILNADPWSQQALDVVLARHIRQLSDLKRRANLAEEKADEFSVDYWTNETNRSWFDFNAKLHQELLERSRSIKTAMSNECKQYCIEHNIPKQQCSYEKEFNPNKPEEDLVCKREFWSKNLSDVECTLHKYWIYNIKELKYPDKPASLDLDLYRYEGEAAPEEPEELDSKTDSSDVDSESDSDLDDPDTFTGGKCSKHNMNLRADKSVLRRQRLLRYSKKRRNALSGGHLSCSDDELTQLSKMNLSSPGKNRPGLAIVIDDNSGLDHKHTDSPMEKHNNTPEISVTDGDRVNESVPYGEKYVDVSKLPSVYDDEAGVSSDDSTSKKRKAGSKSKPIVVNEDSKDNYHEDSSEYDEGYATETVDWIGDGKIVDHVDFIGYNEEYVFRECDEDDEKYVVKRRCIELRLPSKLFAVKALAITIPISLPKTVPKIEVLDGPVTIKPIDDTFENTLDESETKEDVNIKDGPKVELKDDSKVNESSKTQSMFSVTSNGSTDGLPRLFHSKKILGKHIRDWELIYRYAKKSRRAKSC